MRTHEGGHAACARPKAVLQAGCAAWLGASSGAAQSRATHMYAFLLQLTSAPAWSGSPAGLPRAVPPHAPPARHCAPQSGRAPPRTCSTSEPYREVQRTEMPGTGFMCCYQAHAKCSELRCWALACCMLWCGHAAVEANAGAPAACACTMQAGRRPGNSKPLKCKQPKRRGPVGSNGA